MRLDHEFTVDAPVDRVWAAVVDPERVAPCMPGATLSAVEGDAFRGSVKVKLGPVSMVYKGSGEFVAKDAAERRVVIKASGKDARGAGTASATVTVTLHDEDGSTRGSVATDLTVTGRPAQFGRGMIAEVGGKILDTFAGCLGRKLTTEPAADSTGEPAGERPKASVAGGATARRATPAAPPGEAEAAARRAKAATDPAPSSADGAAGVPVTDTPPAPEPVPTHREDEPAAPAPAEPAAAKAGTPGAIAGPTAAAEPAGAPTRRRDQHSHLRGVPDHPPAEPETDAIDLMQYAGSSAAKRLAPVLAVAVLVALIATLRALRRR
ncbi:Carbon monoxide dehydrogenase subunit G [Amycolatopsis arida]|uniref:Carbon monoxide dehydrogenase subunit G n=1 Tax=Amycolatopsis arida TaxID=587909 RepID=A0A1I5L1L2_9PSEU|nr:SRPBCC family protein [Amycolatopsis arida]TDX93548.1 carbon monoxide dehydrogenase subunit G [Amycolatopsis arida]SFO91214.1 Carbon monoxide dehydrogenase subunit G [Amycolatopsis arida]